ncbi:hypothetical protein [Glutamicibacter sp. TV12E]|uniref:hypothetical protein n=1 Tax=Glutamicibacter sp. TV12E TaxID=3446362 RepID=UPI004034E88A
MRGDLPRAVQQDPAGGLGGVAGGMGGRRLAHWHIARGFAAGRGIEVADLGKLAIAAALERDLVGDRPGTGGLLLEALRAAAGGQAQRLGQGFSRLEP